MAVLGFFGLALWQVVEAVGGSFGEGMDAWAGRGKAIAKAVVYLVLGWTTLGFARGKQSSSKQQTVDFTASMLQSTAGRVLVVVIGLVVIGVGVYHVYKGATKRFLRDLAENPGTAPPAPGRSATSPRGSPWPSSGCSSSWPASPAGPVPPGAWTPPCTRCATSRWGRCC